METNTERYDRQIRLWGQHGQNKCSDARVCLINANSLGSEILKGLCLAGIGSYSLLDSHRLTNEDIGCSLLPHNARGKNRGEVVKDLMTNLNSDVIGQVHPVEKYLPQDGLLSECNNDNKDGKANNENEILVCENINFWKQFNIVISTGFLHTSQMKDISRICWSLSIPLIVCKSIGFYGIMMNQVPEHIVIDTHSDNPLPCFELDRPFRELDDYLGSINLDDDSQLDNVNSYPYLVIIYHYLKRWQKQNDLPKTRVPQTNDEKIELKKLVKEGLKEITKRYHERGQKCTGKSQTNSESQEILFENFLEADKGINSCFSLSSSKLPDHVKSIFDNPKVEGSFETSRPSFWLIMAAIKEFYKRHSILPVSGSIPDMTASSKQYLTLQSLYQKRSREDIEEVYNIVMSMIPAGGYAHGQSLFEETKLLCRNIRDLRLINTNQLDFNQDLNTTKTVKEDYEHDESIAIEVALKALDIFYSTYSRLPGVERDSIETDIAKLKDCLRKLMIKDSSKLKNLDQCLYELCRYGGSELHATSAFMGGCVTQESIKFITNQYLPIQDTLIYDAMSGSLKTHQFADALSS